MLLLLLTASLAAPTTPATTPTAADPVAGYIERYFETYPSRATEAGRHDRDRELENLPSERLAAWIEFNKKTRDAIAAMAPAASPEDRDDYKLLRARIDWELHELDTRRRPARDPLFWTNIAANATVFLLVREDAPKAERLGAARSRARQIPRLTREAIAAMQRTDPGLISVEFLKLAEGQARATARFYREGFSTVFSKEERSPAAADGSAAAASLDQLAVWFERIAKRSTGSPRLASDYASALKIATGEPDPDAMLARAEADLAAKKTEAAAYGRSIWKKYFPKLAAPADDRQLLAKLFARVSADRAKTVGEFVADYRRQVSALDAYLHAHPIVTLPDPLTLYTDRSPGYFAGQAVGGVYAAGPYAPDAKTLWFLPTPPDSATPAAREGFFRDFNHHFNVMITPHEILPGHYLQLKVAAHLPRKVRALFPDGVYVEGWGTFSERLMLDSGWGGPLDRLAHLKKQMENIARAIVDVRVHTKEMPREEVLRFVKEDALQDEQFASNMWTRAITTPTQITTYWLGYTQVTRLFEDLKAARGASFRLKDFMDAMLADGPLPVARYREKLLPASAPAR